MFSDVPFNPGLLYIHLLITYMKTDGIVNRSGHQIRSSEAGSKRFIVMFVWSYTM